MDSNGPSGRVTSSTGNVDLDGELVGRVRECGTSLAPPPWQERPGFHERITAAGGDPDVVRRMIETATPA